MSKSETGAVTIRNEKRTDVGAIRHVHSQAFYGDVESRLVDMLRGAGRTVLSLVAVVEDRVVGHVLFSPVPSSPLLETRVGRHWDPSESCQTTKTRV